MNFLEGFLFFAVGVLGIRVYKLERLTDHLDDALAKERLRRIDSSFDFNEARQALFSLKLRQTVMANQYTNQRRELAAIRRDMALSGHFVSKVVKE